MLLSRFCLNARGKEGKFQSLEVRVQAYGISSFTLLNSANLFESERDRCFCQDFVSMQGGRKENFNP